MKIHSIILCSFLLFANYLFAQQSIDVSEQTLKMGPYQEELIYFGFAAGDKIIFQLDEKENRELKEIEIIEYPSSSRFMEFKKGSVNKTIIANQDGIYIFRIKNAAIGNRICKFKIQRIPSSAETQNFNTKVLWKTVYDTISQKPAEDILIGYDTIIQKTIKRELVKTEIKEELLLDKPQRVPSSIHLKGNKTSVFFTLPKNETTDYQSKKVLAWAYWVGVGEEANEAWLRNTKIIKTLVKGVAGYYLTPLGALAAGELTELVLPKAGQDVFYALTDQENKNLFMEGKKYKVLDKGKGVAGYRSFSDNSISQGMYHVVLSNDNFLMALDAQVKVVAMVEMKYYEDKVYLDKEIKPIISKKYYEPVTKARKLPYLEN